MKKKELEEKINNLEFQNESLKAVLEYKNKDIVELEVKYPYAYFYRTLLEIIKKTPAIQGEWAKFLTYLILVGESEDKNIHET